MAIVDLIRAACERWAEPRALEADGFRLRCSMEPAAGPISIDPRTPPDLADLWRGVHTARLFEDVDYGQWGLVLLSPHESARETGEFRRDRARDRIAGDLVVGLFLGDQDRLLVRGDPSADDYGRVVVALPLDRRADWDEPAPTLEAFVRSFIEAEGAKFWTR